MNITEARERDIIASMEGHGWLRPLDLGGHNGSHHNATLSRLVKQGVVERKQRRSWQSRPSYIYRLVPKSTEPAEIDRGWERLNSVPNDQGRDDA